MDYVVIKPTRAPKYIKILSFFISLNEFYYLKSIAQPENICLRERVELCTRLSHALTKKNKQNTVSKTTAMLLKITQRFKCKLLVK